MRSSVFGVDLADLFKPVDIRLIDTFDPASAAYIAPGAEFAVRSAVSVKRPHYDLFPFLARCVFYQYRLQNLFLPRSRRYHIILCAKTAILTVFQTSDLFTTGRSVFSRRNNHASPSRIPPKETAFCILTLSGTRPRPRQGKQPG